MESAQINAAMRQYEEQLGQPAATLAQWVGGMTEADLIHELQTALADGVPVEFGDIKRLVVDMAELHDAFDAPSKFFEYLAAQLMWAVMQRLDEYREAQG